MIIDPDFLDHWKTQMLVNMLDDPCAPLYLIRIWSHCQNRKQTQFKPMPNPGLKALCRYPGDADKLVSALVESGFIEKTDGDSILVVGWEDKNAQLVAAWENGAKGGRPRKNPTVTQPKPNGKPNPDLGEPDEKRLDKSREDKSREEGKETICSASATPPPEPVVPVLEFPVAHKTKKTWALTQTLIDELTEAFPAVDVLQQCKQALAWVKANPGRKDPQGMSAFLTNWMSRQQNKGSPGAGKSSGPNPAYIVRDP